MRKIEFHLVRPDDERLEVFLNGEEIGSYNHDEHGWDGINVAEELVENISRLLDADIHWVDGSYLRG